MRVLSTICWSTLLFASQALAKPMFISRDNTKLLADKKSSASTVQLLNAGESVNVEDEGGNFLYKKVSTAGGKSGFVPYTSLTEKSDASWKKVVNYVKGFTKPENNEVESAKARSANAVMGIRGLTDTSSGAMSQVSNARPNLKAVYQMEERLVPENKIAGHADSVFKETEDKLNP